MKIGTIYKIDINDNDIYVGSTSQQLCQRQSNHNSYLKCRPHQKLYKLCIENNIDKIKCVWIANIKYESCAELRMIEEKYRTELNANVNMRKCFQTKEERIEQLKKNQKKYNDNHKDKIKETNKKYNENNKDKKREYDKDRNKNKIYEKVKCDLCGTVLCKHNLLRHQKTMSCKKHYECIFSDDD
jgi:hypothetical protein|tara:strand:+ start:35 stop:589 length:555 start_codon:yes stop_codon:yes gene_type:complete